jgi:hypothetical protein
MTPRGDHRSLWADPLPDEPEAGSGDTARWEAEEDEPQPTEPRIAKERPGRVGVAVLAVVVATALLAVLTDRGAPSVQAVPSAWDDIPMRCETLRLERAGSALEAFSCRATGAGRLPPGVYRTPASQWTSDLTRRDARHNEMRIDRDGRLVGWAVY